MLGLSRMHAGSGMHVASDMVSDSALQVCSRLGLVSLAYLWRQPQARLLRDMYQAGIHAILVKVAAIGACNKHNESRLLGNIHALGFSLSSFDQIFAWQAWTPNNT